MPPGCFDPNSNVGFIPQSSSSPTSASSSYLTNVGIHFAAAAAASANDPSSPSNAFAYENSNQLRIKLFQHFSNTSGNETPSVAKVPSTSSFMPSQSASNEINNTDIVSTSQSSQLHVKCEDKHVMGPVFGLGMGMIKKPKKSRVLFSQWQINELEKLFKKQKYVTSNERELMAKRLKLQANQVRFRTRNYPIF